MANIKKASNGALSGASKGAAIGSVVPGLGTALGAGIGGLVGGIGGLFGGKSDEERAMEEMQANKELWAKLNAPNMSWENFSPEEMKYLGDFNPEMANASMVEEDPMMKSAQRSALERMAGLSESGLTAEDELSRNTFMRTAGREAKSGRESAMDSARARGVSGGGLEFALREMASQEAQDRAQTAGLQGAAQTANQRALYNKAYLDGTGDLRDQDYRASAANAGILNQFNMANTGARNDAAQTNLSNRQQMSNVNTGMRNDAQKYNQAGRTDTQQQNFGNAVTKLNGMTGANTGMANAYAARDAANQSNNNANTGLLFQAGSQIRKDDLDAEKLKKGIV